MYASAEGETRVAGVASVHDIGSPGWVSGTKAQAYDVMSFDKSGAYGGSPSTDARVRADRIDGGGFAVPLPRGGLRIEV